VEVGAAVASFDQGKRSGLAPRGSVPAQDIGVGRPYAGTYVRLLVQDLDITIVDTAAGELLRELVLVPPATTSPPDDQPDQSRTSNNGPTSP
jgi:hypothetical protein